jgi:hypothetical protein
LVVDHENCRVSLQKLHEMASNSKQGVVIATGADGRIGREVCRLLKTSGTKFLATDVGSGLLRRCSALQGSSSSVARSRNCAGA